MFLQELDPGIVKFNDAVGVGMLFKVGIGIEMTRCIAEFQPIALFSIQICQFLRDEFGIQR